VEWLSRTIPEDILWIDPYPTRLPKIEDFSRLHIDLVEDVKRADSQQITVIRPTWIPLEPIRGSIKLQNLLWRDHLKSIENWASGSEVRLIAGKPSNFLRILRSHFDGPFLFDYMDSFPDFYSGSARKVMSKNLEFALQSADAIALSSKNMSGLLNRESEGKAFHLPNGHSLPNRLEREPTLSKKNTIGYVGSIAGWFDWEYLASLARLLPRYEFEVCGPRYSRVPANLPGNVSLSEAVPHDSVPSLLSTFAAGLIPFKVNRLTEFVDPIKYHEYRAMSLPVIASPFAGLEAYAQDRSLLRESIFELKAEQVTSFIEREHPDYPTNYDWASLFDLNDGLASFLSRH
jgi:hypothetical protein